MLKSDQKQKVVIIGIYSHLKGETKAIELLCLQVQLLLTLNTLFGLLM